MSSDGIKRFPRLPEGFTLKNAPILFPPSGMHLSRTQKFERRMALGDVPSGYNRLKKKHKKLVRLIASGYGIEEACRKMHMSRETFYRLRRAHPIFREYLTKQVAKNLTDIQVRHGRQVIRASQVIDEALDMPDPYFAANIAKDVLKGRGEWKTSSKTEVDQKLSGKVGIEASLTVDDKGLTRESMDALVQALSLIALGSPPVNERAPKILTVGEDNALEALPPIRKPERAAAT